MQEVIFLRIFSESSLPFLKKVTYTIQNYFETTLAASLVGMSLTPGSLQCWYQ